MFSDCTLVIDHDHKFLVHSVVLGPKCRWFSNKFVPSKVTTIPLNRQFHPACLEPLYISNDSACHFKHGEVKASTCFDASIIQEMLRFCYTGSYENLVGADTKLNTLRLHFLMNYWKEVRG
jgi:hypothetical protein